MSLPHHLLAVVDPVTFAINLSLIIGGLLLAAFLFVVGVVSYTGLRAWWFARRQRKSIAAYDRELIDEKVEWKKMQEETFLRNPKRRPG